MTVKTGLEAALAAAWDRETLAVYADHLQAEGDPRGELIALDLELAHRSAPELVTRRTSLLAGWLGSLVPSNPHTSWIGDSFRFGFVENLVLDGEDPDHEQHLAQMLDSPLAPYLKRVTIRGDAAHATHVLTALAALPHAWLAELSITARGGGELAQPAVDAFVAATPALAHLELTGAPIVKAFPHPALRRLTLAGRVLFDGLYQHANGLEQVTALDLALFDPGQPYASSMDRVPPPFVLPGLRTLDLSRNEPEQLRGGGYADYEDPDIDYEPDTEQAVLVTAFDLLRTQPLRAQLTHVRLPSIRTADELGHLETIAGTMPKLVEIEIARGHYLKLPATLGKSAIALNRPAAWAWPRPDGIPDGDSLHVVAPGSRSGDTVPLVDAARVMEQRFETLDAETRYAWTRFWVFVAELGALPWKSDPAQTWTDERTFPAQLLVTALETCEIGGSGGWRELRDELRYRRPLPPDAVLTVHRVRSLG